MLFLSESQKLAANLAGGKPTFDAQAWEAVLADARSWRPPLGGAEGGALISFDQAQLRLRHMYEGLFADDLAAAIKARFPRTGHRMTIPSFNLAKLYAENGAAVFDLPPAFTLHASDGTLLRPTDTGDGAQAAQDFAGMIEEASVQLVLAEVERRSLLTGDHWIRVSSDSLTAAALGVKPPTTLSLFWSTDVYVIPHPGNPTSLETAFAIIVRVGNEDGCEKWEHWSRVFTPAKEPRGLPTFGPWSCELVTIRRPMRGAATLDSEILWNPYPFRSSPWVKFSAGMASGTPYADLNRNLPDLLNVANSSTAGELFSADLNAATVLVRKTADPQPKTVAMGAGLLLDIGIADELVPVQLSTDFTGIRSVNRGVTGMIAATGRQRIEGFDTEASSQPASGTALRIKNEPQSKARLESVARMRPMANRLLAVMAEVNDEFRATNILGEGRKAQCEPQDPPEYEDVKITQDRYVQLRDMSLVTDEMVLMASRVAPTEEAARAIIERAEQQAVERMPSALAAVDAAVADAQDPAQHQDPEHQDGASNPVV